MSSEDSYWLVHENGVQVRIAQKGILMGRGAHCDVLLSDPQVSRAQVLLRPAAQAGVALYVLGRLAALVNDEEVERSGVLRDGDRLQVGTSSWHVRAFRSSKDAHTGLWNIVLDGDLQMGLHGGPVRVGGSPQDDLFIDGLPPGLLSFQQHRGAVVVCLGAFVPADYPIYCDGELMESEAVEVLSHKQALSFGAHTLHLLRDGPAQEETVEQAHSHLLTSVQLSFLPVGAQIQLQSREHTAELHLSELRARLFAILLRPPGSYAPGDFLPDDMLLESIWPGETERTRLDLNTLVHRIRNSLLQAGCHPAHIIERAKGGGGTRLMLAPHAALTIH